MATIVVDAGGIIAVLGPASVLTQMRNAAGGQDLTGSQI
jgi:hypothetical protein